MPPTSRGLIGLLMALVLAVQAPAAAHDTRRAPPPDFALVGGTVIDGTAPPPRPKCTVVLRGGRIAAIGPDEAVPEGVTTIDVTGNCICPGMIESDEDGELKVVLIDVLIRNGLWVLRYGREALVTWDGIEAWLDESA
jgi:hypothetical protein